MKTALFACLLAAASPAFCSDLELMAKNYLGRHYIEELDSDDARDSIFGTKGVWTELSLQLGAQAAGLEGLEAELRDEVVEGPIAKAGLKVLDPKKKSLALIGQKPTLQVSVLYFPESKEGNKEAFYLVWARTAQELTPTGGRKVTLPTWARIQPPVLCGDGPVKDRAAIRAAVKQAVAEFIEIALGLDQEKAEKPAPKAGEKTK